MRTTIRAYELVVQQRVEEGLKYIQADPRPSPAKNKYYPLSEEARVEYDAWCKEKP